MWQLPTVMQTPITIRNNLIFTGDLFLPLVTLFITQSRDLLNGILSLDTKKSARDFPCPAALVR
jgi:hypothetical protein